MAEQVNSTGSLSGLPMAVLAAPLPRATPEKAPPISADDAQPRRLEGQVATGGLTSPDAALTQINSHLQQASSDLKIQVDQDTGRAVYQVVDNSGRVILQIPSAEVLAMARNLRALDAKKVASGVLVDKQG